MGVDDPATALADAAGLADKLPGAGEPAAAETLGGVEALAAELPAGDAAAGELAEAAGLAAEPAGAAAAELAAGDGVAEPPQAAKMAAVTAVNPKAANLFSTEIPGLTSPIAMGEGQSWGRGRGDVHPCFFSSPCLIGPEHH